MAIFTLNTALNESTNYVDESMVSESKYEPNYNGALMNIVDIEKNYNMMMESVALAELNAYSETGQDFFIQEGTISGFFAKVKEFFMMVGRKIAEIFKKFVAMLQSLVMKDKDFIKKYRTEILKGSTKDLKINGYNFTTDEKTFSMKDLAENGKEFLNKKLDVDLKNVNTGYDDEATKKWNENLSDNQELLRGAMLGKTNSLSTQEFHDEIFEKLRNGQSSKEEIDNISPSTSMKIVEDYSEIKKKAERAYTDLKKEVNDLIKDFEQHEKELGNLLKDDKDSKKDSRSASIRRVSARVAAEKNRLQYLQEANGLYMSALKAERSQHKAICIKLIGRKESASVTESYNDFFKPTQFI